MTSKHQTTPSPLIVLTAGGTGGHVYPAEALAEELLKHQYRVILVTDKRGQNNYHGALGKIQNYAVFSGAVMGKSTLTRIKNLFKTGIGIIQCLYLLLRMRPSCVVGFGGYASFPCCMAAILLGTDLVIHEQNSVMSRTNRFLCKYATFIATSFKKTKYAPSGRKTIQTGMPVRKAILDLYDKPYPKLTANGTFNIAVIGGSQGAKIFTDIVPEAIKLLDVKYQKRIRIAQQCRKEDIENLESIYKQTKCKTRISNFFDNMAEIYAQSHLIISRAGASSVSEIAVAGRPAILIPLPTAADDHQTSNASEFKISKSGIILQQKDLSPTILASILNDCLHNLENMRTMAKNTKKIAITDAAERLCNLIEKKILFTPKYKTEK